MSGTPTSLYDACSDLLNIAVAALGTLAPARRYVSVALPALDCGDQITVHPALVQQEPLLANTPILPGPLHSVGPAVITADLIITVAWCITTPTEPTDTIPADVLDGEAATVASGGWALWNGVRSAARQEVTPFSLCKGLEIAQLQPLYASGAMAGWTLPVRTQLDGYDITFLP